MKSLQSWQPKTADPEVLRRVKAAILKVVPDAEVILYGSRARGDTTDPYADYDILVLVDGPADMALKDKILDELFPIELDTGAVLTFGVQSNQEWESALFRAHLLRENIQREGVVL